MTGRLEQLPDGFATTRDHLHQVAFFAISPSRYRATGRMGLRHQPGGFGTPEFGGRVVRVAEDMIFDASADHSAARKISSVRDAAEFLGIDYEVDWFPGFHDPLQPLDPDLPLEIDPAATSSLGEWFGFAWEVLESLRSNAGSEDDPSEIQLWPEHFDAATEIGDNDAGQRASYGASPGDGGHDEPYLYVAAWSPVDRAVEYWNDTTFNGSSLSYRALLGADDQARMAIDFFLQGYQLLHN